MVDQNISHKCGKLHEDIPHRTEFCVFSGCLQSTNMIISSFPAGDTYTSITDFKQPKTMCPHCKKQAVIVSVFLKYNHINWFPMHTKGESGDIFCTNCRGLDETETYPDYILEYAQQQLNLKSRTKRFLLLCATLFWLTIGFFAYTIISMFI